MEKILEEENRGYDRKTETARAGVAGVFTLILYSVDMRRRFWMVGFVMVIFWCCYSIGMLGERGVGDDVMLCWIGGMGGGA